MIGQTMEIAVDFREQNVQFLLPSEENFFLFDFVLTKKKHRDEREEKEEEKEPRVVFGTIEIDCSSIRIAASVRLCNG